MKKLQLVKESQGTNKAIIDIGRNVGGGCCAPIRGGRAGSPSKFEVPSINQSINQCQNKIIF